MNKLLFAVLFLVFLSVLVGSSQEAFAADFGDAPPSYGTPNHTTCGPVYLGSTNCDTEVTPFHTLDATGDDVNGVDDEDGVTIAPLIRGSGSSVTLSVVNPGGAISCFSGWIDFDKSGGFDANERLTITPDPCGGGSQTINFNVPAGAALGDTFARFRVQNTFGTLGPTGTAGTGEVEDYLVTILAPPPEADLRLDKSVSDDFPNVGDTITFTIVVTNDGPDTSMGIQVKDVLDTDLTFNAGSVTDTSGGTFDGTTWILGSSLASGASATLTFTADVTSTIPMFNSAEIILSSLSDPDSTPGNGILGEDDDDFVPLNVQAADLRIQKTVDKLNSAIGDTVTYTITVANDGPTTATNVQVTDTIPAGVTFVKTTGCNNDPAGLPTCNLIDIPNGGSVQYTIEVTVDGSILGPLLNTAEITASDQFDPDSTPGNGILGEDDDATVTITVTGRGGEGSVTAQDPNLGDVRHGIGHDNGFCMNQSCMKVNGLFNHFPERTVPQGSTQSFTILVNCPRGANTCSHISLAGVLPESDFYDDQWSATVDRQPRSDNWDLTTNNPFGEIGDVTVTVQQVSQSFISVTFNIPFLIPGSIGTHDGIGDPHENNRHLHVTVWDNNGGMSNYIFNEGVYVDDIYAYPKVETSYEKPIELEPLCLGENPNKRYSCAFDKVREWTIKNAEKALLEIEGKTELDLLNEEFLSKFRELKQAIAAEDLEKISDLKEQLDELGSKIHSRSLH